MLLAADLRAADGAAEPPFRYYSVVDGLTQSEVHDIEQDLAGYLWFTTSRGLNRFDGREFQSYTIADGLLFNSLTALDVGDDNTVWVGDERGGVVMLSGGNISETIQPLKGDTGAIVDIEAAGDHVVAIVEDHGVVQVVGDAGQRSLKVIAGEWAQPVKLVEGRENFWIVAKEGLYRLKVDPQPEVRLSSRNIVSLYGGPEELWAITDKNVVGRYDDHVFEPVHTLPADFAVTDAAPDRQGSIWVASATRLVKVTPGTTDAAEATITSYEGFEELNALYVDRENTLWLSSSSRLVRFLGERFEHYKLQTGAEPATIWAITQDSQGRYWFGTQSHLMLRNPDATLTILGKAQGVPPGAVRDLIADGRGRLWAGIREQGLYEIDPAALRGSRIEGTEGMTVLDLDVADDGRIWMGTMDRGVYRYDPENGSLARFELDGVTAVYTLDVAGDGSVWYGADEFGLVRLSVAEDGSYDHEVFGPEAGLGHDLFDHVYMIGNRSAWVATEEGGLYRFENDRFENFGTDKPFSDQTVYLVEPLPNGTIVIGGEQGLYQFLPGEDRTVHYNQASNFLGLENNVHATYMDTDGWLWIGTVDGASRMNTALPMPPKIDLTPQIVSMTTLVGDDEVASDGEVENGARGLSVRYAAISLSNPGSVEMSYVLQGVNESWSPATNNRIVEYTRLPPGDHKFVVRARYHGGDWSNVVASRSFTVHPFFWQRPAFILGAILAFLAAIRAAFAYRTRHINRINQMLKEQVSERTRSIEEARRELQASNEALSLEVEERRKAENARLELETRFRKAFENAPIGMGLLDRDGLLFDANPALRQMFWSGEAPTEDAMFAAVIEDADRERFAECYEKLIDGDIEDIEERFDCTGADGGVLHAEVSVSTIDTDDGDFLYAVVQVQDLTESLQLTDRLEYQAKYDELTGLYNRRAFETELQRAWDGSRDDGESSYLLYMDLDQFKVVNDTSGHAAGDKLLQQLAEILVSKVRSDDTVGRMGGDEFAIILWTCPRNVAERIAESIREAVYSYRFQWDTEIYKVGISIGCVPLDPLLGDIVEIQQLADSACFTAKEEGRNRVHLVEGDKGTAQAHRRQIRWVQRLREAMDNNRFAIYAQKIQPLGGGDNGPPRFEILLRLRDPETRRLIPPGAFLPAAERYGLSIELDEWVVRNLVTALYLHQSFNAEPCRYWINLSGTSIGEKRFATFLRQIVEQSPLPPGTLNFEITETAVIRNVSEAGHLIGELRDMGCEFALDDFGSGLSSFGYLRKLPVGVLKIDGMFIRNIVSDRTDRIFVKSIIDIAHTLNIQTVCELIETEEMLKVVTDLGADFAQGFAVERPFELAPCFPGIEAADSQSTTRHKKAV